MRYFLNELSVLTPCKASREEGIALMEEFIGICNKLTSLGYTTLVYKHSLKGICLAENYYIESWINDANTDKDLKDVFIQLAVNTPFTTSDDLSDFESPACFYYYNGQDSDAFREAYLIKSVVVSLDTATEWDTTSIEVVRFCDDSEKRVQVLHVSTKEHIELIRRIFEFNPKHGKCGRGEHHGQSKMYCCTEKEAERLLNTAIEHPNRAKGLCNYDSKNRRFVVFYPHDQDHNKYHGFHYENTRVTDPDRDLNNAQNGISRSLQGYLKQRIERQ